MNAAKPGHIALVLFMALGVNGTARAEAPHEHGIALLQIAIAWASAFSKPVILEWINALNGALGIG